jgi:hypothetical protein
MTIKELAPVVRRRKTPGLNETTYYLSATDLNIFYALQLRYALDTSACNEKEQKELVYSKLEVPAQLEELFVFKLHWDYRRLDLTPTLSALRVFSFPLKYSQERISEAIRVLRQHYCQFTGLGGIWIGYSYNPKPTIGKDEKLRCLIRTDWLNQQAYFEFTNSAAMQDIIQRSTIYSTEFSYAVGQMIDIYRPDTLVESTQIHPS